MRPNPVGLVGSKGQSGKPPYVSVGTAGPGARGPASYILGHSHMKTAPVARP